MSERLHQRVPYSMRVQFRNASSFLVAYTVNLSRGGVFLETEQMLPVGTSITLQLEVPGEGPMNVPGHVSWRREVADVEGPIGIGIEFDDLSNTFGSTIDRLVSEFSGLTVLLICPEGRERMSITRQLRSMITTAEIVSVTIDMASSVLGDDVDLLVVDMENDSDEAIELITKAQTFASPVPCVAVSSEDSLLARARKAGAIETISSPPSFGDLHQSMMRALGRPLTVKKD